MRFFVKILTKTNEPASSYFLKAKQSFELFSCDWALLKKPSIFQSPPPLPHFKICFHSFSPASTFLPASLFCSHRSPLLSSDNDDVCPIFVSSREKPALWKPIVLRRHRHTYPNVTRRARNYKGRAGVRLRSLAAAKTETFCVLKFNGGQVRPFRCHGNRPLWACKSVFLSCALERTADAKLRKWLVCSSFHHWCSCSLFSNVKPFPLAPSRPGDPRQRRRCGSDLCLRSSGALPPRRGSNPGVLTPAGLPRTAGIGSGSVGWWVWVSVLRGWAWAPRECLCSHDALMVVRKSFPKNALGCGIFYCLMLHFRKVVLNLPLNNLNNLVGLEVYIEWENLSEMNKCSNHQGWFEKQRRSTRDEGRWRQVQKLNWTQSSVEASRARRFCLRAVSWDSPGLRVRLVSTASHSVQVQTGLRPERIYEAGNTMYRQSSQSLTKPR